MRKKEITGMKEPVYMINVSFSLTFSADSFARFAMLASFEQRAIHQSYRSR